jgi:steroid delta-isomerase-like uncharacterized protein
MTEATTQGRTAAEVARSYFEAAARQDLDAMAAHWHEDGVDDLVPIGPLRGPGEVRRFFEEMFAACPDWQFTVDRITADERVACVQWRVSATFEGGPFQGLEPTGSHIELRGVDCVEVEDGLIVRNTAYYDGAAFARAVGMLPAQGSAAERAMMAAFNGVTKLRAALRERGSR